MRLVVIAEVAIVVEVVEHATAAELEHELELELRGGDAVLSRVVTTHSVSGGGSEPWQPAEAAARELGDLLTLRRAWRRWRRRLRMPA